MTSNIFHKGLSLLLRRQTNILSAAFVIMTTVIISQILGLIRQRLLYSIFGASDTVGVYLAANRLPDLLFQVIIAGALYSAFIPVFSDFLVKGKEEEGHKMASALLMIGSIIFTFFSIILFIFAPLFVQLINLGSQFTPDQMILMVHLMRIVIFSQILFIVGTFFSALLQSYSHFFIPGIAAAMYNLGIIFGIVAFSDSVGIFAPAFGSVIGALFFIVVQLPMVKKIGFTFFPSFKIKTAGVLEVIRLMWPRVLSNGVFQLGSLATLALVSFLSNPGRNYAILDVAQTLAFAPVSLIGQALAQAAFPVLSRERERLSEFKVTFITSFTQMFYLILPISALLLVLRIPVVRLVFGSGQFDWDATVLAGRILAFFSFGIFAQALIYLVSRGFYALHDTRMPLIVGSFTTGIMVCLGTVFVLFYHLGVESIAFAYSISGILNLLILFLLLDRKIGGFGKKALIIPFAKIFIATLFTAVALYIPIKLLDQLVFDTTKTINLLFLTGISSTAGLIIYLFLTWLFNVKEAMSFILLGKKLGNWREILRTTDQPIDGTRFNP